MAGYATLTLWRNSVHQALYSGSVLCLAYRLARHGSPPLVFEAGARCSLPFVRSSRPLRVTCRFGLFINDVALSLRDLRMLSWSIGIEDDYNIVSAFPGRPISHSQPHQTAINGTVRILVS